MEYIGKSRKSEKRRNSRTSGKIVNYRKIIFKYLSNLENGNIKLKKSGYFFNFIKTWKIEKIRKISCPNFYLPNR